MAKSLNITFEFEKKVSAFAADNFNRSITETENCYLFTDWEEIDLVTFNESVMETLKGYFAMMKQYLKGKSHKEASFNIYGVSFNNSTYNSHESEFRIGIYISFNKIEKIYIRDYGKAQIEYTIYNNEEKKFDFDSITLPFLKSHVKHFIKCWTEANLKVSAK